MKRPFLIVALLYIGGIMLGEFFRPPLPALFALSLSTALAGVLWGNRRVYCLAALLILAGWTNQVYRTAIISPVDLRLLIEDHTEMATLRGTLCSSPTERIFERKQQERWRSSSMIEVTEIKRDDHWQPATGKVSVSTMGLLDSDFFTGQTVEITDAVLSPPRGPQAPGLFDSQSYLRRKGVYYQAQTKTNDWHMLDSGEAKTMPLPDRFHAWAKKTLALGLPEEDLSQRLIWTLMLDWRAPMTENVQEPFMRAGTFD